MSVTNPIKDKEALARFKAYYVSAKPNPRNYTLIIMELNTAFRIGDLLQLRWEDVYNHEKDCPKGHICIKEQKTGKERIVPINGAERKTLTAYHDICKHTAANDFLFYSLRNKTRPISRYQAYRIIKEAATESGLEEHISCHSLRKTFGYHAWKQGTPPVMLMELYNHSSYCITKRYLGIEQDERDDVYLNIEL